MKIYLSHSSSHDYQKELYQPLKDSLAEHHDIYFPHDTHPGGVNTKALLPVYDVVLAEVSYPSTGQGIELGWADAMNVPIICIHRTDTTPSSAVRFISPNVIAYDTTTDMITKVLNAINP